GCQSLRVTPWVAISDSSRVAAISREPGRGTSVHHLVHLPVGLIAPPTDCRRLLSASPRPIGKCLQRCANKNHVRVKPNAPHRDCRRETVELEDSRQRPAPVVPLHVP